MENMNILRYGAVDILKSLYDLSEGPSEVLNLQAKPTFVKWMEYLEQMGVDLSLE